MLEKKTFDRIVGSKLKNSNALEQLCWLGRHFLENGSARGVTALRSQTAILEEFLLDSLAGVEFLPASGTVADIGTGGGVPGLVLAIVRTDLDFVLTDSAHKKTDWVFEVVQELKLSNVKVVTKRLEVLGRDPEFREQFDLVTAKALAGLNVLCEFAVPLLKVGGRLIAYKGPGLAQEITEARVAFGELGSEVRRCSGYTIGEKQYSLCEIVKTKDTPEKYPRRDGVPQKKPLR